MDAHEIKVRLWETIRSEVHPNKEHGDAQLSVRCPFCGDSMKNADSTHFYIKINTRNEEEPIMYHCFKCDIGGIMRPEVLRMLEVNNLGLNSSLIKFNKKAIKTISKANNFRDNKLNFIIPSTFEDDIAYQKKAYLEGRLGRSFTFKELENLRVILRLSHFLKVNEITKLTCHKAKAMMLNKDYIGFLSTRNEFIDFRKVNPSAIGKRYEKYRVVDLLDQTRKFYTIPNEIDLLTTDTITINITEGVITLLGVYFNVRKEQKENQIYVAASGSGYENAIKYFIRKGVIGDVVVNVYADRDKPKYFIKKQIRDIQPWVKEVNLFYNNYKDPQTKKYENDFGVTKDRIEVIRERLT